MKRAYHTQVKSRQHILGVIKLYPKPWKQEHWIHPGQNYIWLGKLNMPITTQLPWWTIFKDRIITALITKLYLPINVFLWFHTKVNHPFKRSFKSQVYLRALNLNSWKIYHLDTSMNLLHFANLFQNGLKRNFQIVISIATRFVIIN